MYHFGLIKLVNSTDLIKFLDTKIIDYRDKSITDFSMLFETNKWTYSDMIIFSFKVFCNLGYDVRSETINNKTQILYKKHNFWLWFRYDEQDKGIRAYCSLELALENIAELTK